ncbi:MAG: hypothetical protein WCK63_00605 [Betaproteobacteria bacterium]
MSRPDLERTAYTVECFLNALRLNDGHERTKLEAILTRWLAAPGHREDEFVIYSDGRVECRSRGKEYNTFKVPEARQDKTIWCDGSHISIVDGEEFWSTGKLRMLGKEGLDISLPTKDIVDTVVKQNEITLP